MTDDMGMEAVPPRHVTISADAFHAAVVMDGVDVSRAVRSYTVQQQSGEPPLIVFQLSAQHKAEFDGVARVVVAEDTAVVLGATEFLTGIDAGALEDAAMQRDLDGQPGEITRAMLEQLIAWSKGEK